MILILLILAFLAYRFYRNRKAFIYESTVDGFEGDCRPTWLNTNQVYNRLDGGVTGFFKRVRMTWLGVYIKTGKEFHGIILHDGKIRSTKLAED